MKLFPHLAPSVRTVAEQDNGREDIDDESDERERVGGPREGQARNQPAPEGLKAGLDQRCAPRAVLVLR